MRHSRVVRMSSLIYALFTQWDLSVTQEWVNFMACTFTAPSLSVATFTVKFTASVFALPIAGIYRFAAPSHVVTKLSGREATDYG